MASIEDRIAEWQIVVDATLLGTNDQNRSKQYPDGEHLWRVEVSSKLPDAGPPMTIREYVMGSAYQQTPPSDTDVLDSLRSEASGVIDGEEFEDWAENFGMDTDSRAAVAIYRDLLAQTRSLQELLGEDRLRALVYDTEGE